MSLLPPNSTAQERALEATTTRIGNVPIGIDDLWNPAKCPLALLPWLAWGLSVDDWDSAWTEAQKRSVIQQAVSTQRIKGTRASVQRSLDAYGNRSLLWEPQDDPRLDPFTFRVDVEIRDRAVDLDIDYDKSIDTINRTKNVRSHLVQLEIVAANDGIANILTGVQAGEFGSVYPYFGGSVASVGIPAFLLAGFMCEIGSVYPGPSVLPPPPPPTVAADLEMEDGSGFIFLEDGTPLELDGIFVVPTTGNYFLLETGFDLLLEDGSGKLLLEGTGTPATLPHVLLEDGGLLLLESGGGAILLEGAGPAPPVTSHLLIETGFKLVLENGAGTILLE